MLDAPSQETEAPSRPPSISSQVSPHDTIAPSVTEASITTASAAPPSTEPSKTAPIPVPIPSIEQPRPSVQRHKTQLSTSQSSKRLYSLAKGKTTNVLNSLAVRSKNSVTSLRSRSPSHSKTISGSTAGTKEAHLSSLSSAETQSSASSIYESQLPKGSGINLERQVASGASPSAGRKSVDRRRLLDRSPSPSAVSDTTTLTSLPATNRHNKMHQTSSRLLRMTEDERPFTRDFKDLFSTLMVSLPLTPHRVRFQKVDFTFTSEEAINNLGSLKFSQSNRMPDPKDASRIVTTTTTTTFSMAKEMARSVCQRFMDARFIESADGRPPVTFALKNAVWQMTPKGMHVLQLFCQRNGITQRHVLDVLDSSRNTMQLVILERDFASDKLDQDRATVEVIFKRFVGIHGMNVKPSTTMSDTDSFNDYYDGMIGVKMAKERKINDRVVLNTFTGKAAVDWLMDCSTTVDRRETKEICELFEKHGLIYQAFEDRQYTHQNPGSNSFQPTRVAIYGLTEKGQLVVSGRGRSPDTGNKETGSRTGGTIDATTLAPRDSNNNRLLVIVNDPALRLLFREYLRATHCEENLSFFMEVREFTQNYDTAEKAKMFTRMDAIRESLAAAYGMYFDPYSSPFNIFQDCTMLFLLQVHHASSISITIYVTAWLQE